MRLISLLAILLASGAMPATAQRLPPGMSLGAGGPVPGVTTPGMDPAPPVLPEADPTRIQVPVPDAPGAPPTADPSTQGGRESSVPGQE